VQTIPPQIATIMLAENSFFKGSRMHCPAIAAQLARCAAVAAFVPVCRLLRPRDFALLPAWVLLVERDLNEPRA
jgi:hypothetical protein